MGNTAEMVQQAKIIARATSSLVHGIKLEAESQNDSESQTKLLAAAKQLADATARMVEAAKAAAMNPNDEHCQLALQQTTEDLRQAANNATSENMKGKLMAKLQEQAKLATAASTQLLAAANGAERCNGKNKHTLTPLIITYLAFVLEKKFDVDNVVIRYSRGSRNTYLEILQYLGDIYSAVFCYQEHSNYSKNEPSILVFVAQSALFSCLLRFREP